MGFRGGSDLGAPPAWCKLRLAGASFGPAGHEQMAGPMTWPFSATSLSPAPERPVPLVWPSLSSWSAACCRPPTAPGHGGPSQRLFILWQLPF